MPKDNQPPKDFKEAFHVLRLQKELKEKSVLDKYYIPRQVPRIEQLKQKLLVDRSPAKFLYTGHRKSGKTVQLYRLMADPELAKTYFTVFYSIEEDLEIGDIEYIDILLTNALKLYKSAAAQGLKLDKDVLDDLNSWFEQVSTEVIRETVQEKTKGWETGAKLELWIARIGGSIQNESTSRLQIRERLLPRVSEIIEKSNFIADQIQQKSSKPPLLIIDYLDNLDIASAQNIFQEHTQALLRANFKIIYTVPIALAYSDDFQPVSRQFDETVILPIINSRNSDGSENSTGRELLRNIVLKRIDESLIQDKALDHMIGISNGVLSDLLSIAETCCIKAIATKAPQIDWNMVDEELDTLKNQFKRSIPEDWYPHLVEISQKKDAAHDKMLWEMLYTLAVLEYEPGPWYDVHPVILQILKDKKLLK